MNRPLLYSLTAVAAAGAGWLAGAPSERTGPESRSGRQTPLATGAAAQRGHRPAWEAQIAAVRTVAGAQAETAWIKWAFSVPDSDVPAAIAKLNPNADFHALRCLYARWAKLDPPAAWASFRASRIPETVSHFFVPERDENSGGKMIQSTLNTNPRSLIASRILASMASQDPAAARAIALKLRNPNSSEAKDVNPVGFLPLELDNILGKKGQESPQALQQAAADAAATADTDARPRALTKAARAWALKDPAAACTWLRQLPEADRRSLDLTNLEYGLRAAAPKDRSLTFVSLLEIRNISAGDLNKAFQQKDYPGVPNYGPQAGVVEAATAVKEWTRQDAAAVRTWVASLPDGDLKATLAGAAAGALVRTDVDGAIGLLNQTGGDQSLAVNALMRGWMETDVKAALDWAGKIPDDSLRDESRTTAALQIAATNPALAIETALSVTDSAQRSSIYKAVRISLSWNPAALNELQTKFPSGEWNPPPK